MIRIGQGFDAHRFCDGRDLKLGGIKIEHPRGLEGHSDADVLLHAVADALLGAMGADDLGTHFPPGEEHTRNIDSQEMILYTLRLLSKHRFKVVNIDATLICQEPKIKPYSARIRENIARLCSVQSTEVSLKGKTTEGMGFTGRREGIAAIVVVLIEGIEGVNEPRTGIG
jgi:2-C-methyl-D-erythritol 2,4-cyclodiphosphate synthase